MKSNGAKAETLPYFTKASAFISVNLSILRMIVANTEVITDNQSGKKLMHDLKITELTRFG